MLENFGFGDFVFRLPDRTEVGRAADLRQLLAQLERVPDASLEYHANRDHFSQWYAARTEFALAEAVKPVMVSHFPSIGGLRAHLRNSLLGYIREVQRTHHLRLRPATYDEFVTFAKMGSGSLGGKGRGLAFMQKLPGPGGPGRPGVEVAIPRTLAVASDIFEDFLERNGLAGMPHDCAGMSDEEILDAFRPGRFDRSVRGNWPGSWRWCGPPWRCAPPASWRIPSTSPSPACTPPSCSPTATPAWTCGWPSCCEALKVVYASTYMQGRPGLPGDHPPPPRGGAHGGGDPDPGGLPPGRPVLPHLLGRDLLLQLLPLPGHVAPGTARRWWPWAWARRWWRGSRPCASARPSPRSCPSSPRSRTSCATPSANSGAWT